MTGGYFLVLDQPLRDTVSLDFFYNEQFPVATSKELHKLYISKFDAYSK
jgi:hypothetical protein